MAEKQNESFTKFQRRPPTPAGAPREHGDDVNRPANDPNRAVPEEIELRPWKEGDGTGREGDYVTKAGRVLTAAQVEALYLPEQGETRSNAAHRETHGTHRSSARE